MTQPTPRFSTRPRVLLIAEAANPDWVSVPLIGWSLSQALRDVADVHLVTQVRNRDAILAQGLIEGQDFTAIDTEAVTRPIWSAGQVLRMGKGKGWTMATAVAGLIYPYFERCVWRQFGPDLRAGRYDLVHRVTPLTPTAVSPIAAKCARADVPFLMGPLNGGVPWPKGFDAERRREREWLSYVRSVYKFAPGRRRMFQASAAILAASRHTAGEIPTAYQSKQIYLPENAIDPARFNKRSTQDLTGPLRACFIGRLVPYKGPDMAIEAAADVMRAGKMAFDIVGDGPMRAELEALVARERLSDAVTFHGQVPHEQVQDIAVSSNILLFPSIREFGGGVVLEAMALGLVPVIVDYAGPGELVVPGTGLTVPIGTRAEIVAALRQCLDRIIVRPDDLPILAEAAHRRAHGVFTWPAKAQQIADIYDWILGHRSDRPDPIPGQSL